MRRPSGWTLVVVCACAATARAEVPVNFYGDLGYEANHQGQTANSFFAPHLEIFAAKNVGRLYFLGEIMFEAGAENSFGLDIERLQITYDVADWLRITGGRIHTAIGFYNDAYHHGAYFMVPVNRPVSVDFEDGGGLIPAHSIGLAIDGRVNLGRHLSVRYDIAAANGRGPDADAINNRLDSDLMKAWNFRLRLEPHGALDGLVLGGNVYLDTIAASMTRATKLSERIYGGHLAYQEHDVHFVAEGMYIEHQEQEGAAQLYQDYAVFAELGYSVSDFTPYARFERVGFLGAVTDPFYADAGAQGSYYAPVVGLKWTASDYLALKLQGGMTFYDQPAYPTRYSGQVQAAFAF